MGENESRDVLWRVPTTRARLCNGESAKNFFLKRLVGVEQQNNGLSLSLCGGEFPYIFLFFFFRVSREREKKSPR